MYCGQLHELHLLNTNDDRFVQSALLPPTFPFLALLVAVQLHPRWRAVRSLLQHCCTIDGAPHCFIRRRHSDPHPDVVLIEMFPHLIVLNIPMSCCCFSCCQQILLSINLSIPGVFFFLISSLFSRCFSTRESAIPAAAQLRHRWRATLPPPKTTLRSSSRRGFFLWKCFRL